MRSPMSTSRLVWTNNELAENYLSEANNDMYILPIAYIKSSAHILDYKNYWIDKKRRQTLTLDDMKDIIQQILNKLVYYSDLVIDNIDMDEANDWACDEVDYIQRVIRNLINENNYSDMTVDLLDGMPSTLNIMTALAQLEKILLDITVELLDCQSDPVKLTNFINCTLRGIITE